MRAPSDAMTSRWSTGIATSYRASRVAVSDAWSRLEGSVPCRWPARSGDPESEIDHDGQDDGADDHRLPWHVHPDPTLMPVSVVDGRRREIVEAPDKPGTGVGKRLQGDVQQHGEHQREPDRDEDPTHGARLAQRLGSCWLECLRPLGDRGLSQP